VWGCGTQSLLPQGRVHDEVLTVALPQALVAACSAAVRLRRSVGLPYQCVVPFVCSTGALEQHGVA